MSASPVLRMAIPSTKPLNTSQKADEAKPPKITSGGVLGFVKGFSEMFEKLLGFANEGTNFVFGSMNDQGLAFFFLKVL
ncbi:hypothetical protein MJM04_29530, partial [Salmonella enterica subsp. enterica serovar Cerro]|nr:hypothetical protein [Salmonella enterica subsp. enterica serovar Cerro]